MNSPMIISACSPPVKTSSSSCASPIGLKSRSSKKSYSYATKKSVSFAEQVKCRRTLHLNNYARVLNIMYHVGTKLFLSFTKNNPGPQNPRSEKKSEAQSEDKTHDDEDSSSEDGNTAITFYLKHREPNERPTIEIE